MASLGVPLSFHSLYRHGFVRVAVCVPAVRVAVPAANVQAVLGLARQCSDHGAAVALFPELCLSAYSNEDLFQQDALLEATLVALSTLLRESETLTPVVVVGAPLRLGGQLFNCAIAVYRGRILAVTPKTYLPNYREFYEKRQFVSGEAAVAREIDLLGQRVPFGSDVVVQAQNLPAFVLHMEICEDLWTPIAPSTLGALAGATVLLNLSASNITIGKAEYRKHLCAAQSGKCLAAYLYSAAGPGESTTDLAWDGHALIYENNELLAESPRFGTGEHILYSDIDCERLLQERMRLTSFSDTILRYRSEIGEVRTASFEFEIPGGELALERHVERFPFVPNDPLVRDERCYEAYNIQVHGLLQRLRSIGAGKLVIGVSGGLDSTHALIVAAKTMDALGLPRTNILGVTMPGFATSDQTLQNAHALMAALGVTARELDIKPSCLQMLRDLEHPFAEGEPIYDVTFENVQAGERTSHLFRLANFHNAIVLGTGDLSELALGWCTYGVGDHMSHYNVNASLPKTLIQHLIRWVVDSGHFEPETGRILTQILNTEISPELVPAGGPDGGGVQSTQARVGPYELQDFNLYYVTRYGLRPSKVAFLSYSAWHDPERGNWPFTPEVAAQNTYDLATIRKWLEVFLSRFFGTTQFKRSCVPNGPKVGSGGSLSPRGDWRAPSDGESVVWLEELRNNVPER